MDFVRPVAHVVITTVMVTNGEMRVVDSRPMVLDEKPAHHAPVEEQEFPPLGDVHFSFEAFSWSAPNMTRVRRKYREDRPQKIDVFAGDNLLFTLDFSYDEKGQRKKIIQSITRHVFPTDDPTIFDALMENLAGAPMSVIAFEYDDKGHVVEERHEMIGNVTSVRRFKYREDGLLESESDHYERPDRTSEARFEYEFNKEGDWIVQTVLTKEGDKFTPVTTVQNLPGAAKDVVRKVIDVRYRT